jgi:hypothetical protein
VSVFLAGLRRLPWLYASLVGLGTGVVFAALRLATPDASFDPALLVLIGAFGGSLATVGAERGERARVRRSEAMFAGRPSSLG